MKVDHDVLGSPVVTYPECVDSRYQFENLSWQVVLLRPFFVDFAERLVDVPPVDELKGPEEWVHVTDCNCVVLNLRTS